MHYKLHLVYHYETHHFDVIRLRNTNKHVRIMILLHHGCITLWIMILWTKHNLLFPSAAVPVCTHSWLQHTHKNQTSLPWVYQMVASTSLNPLNQKENGVFLRLWKMGQQALFRLYLQLVLQAQINHRDDPTAAGAQVLLYMLCLLAIPC